jgi:KAP family P-loop domain
MKLFFDLPGFVFVVGLDAKVVELGIEKRYRDPQASADISNLVTGAHYIRKIFQVPYSLSPVSVTQINEFLASVYSVAQLPELQQTEIQTNVEPHLRYLVDAAGMNPREIKRFINTYTLIRKVKPELQIDIVLALQTISFRADWRSIHLALLTFKEVFVDALKRHCGQPDAGYLEALTPDLASVPQSFSTYVENGKPGHAIVANTYDINEYLYSGEATRTSEGVEFVKLFGLMGELFRSVRAAFQGDYQARKDFDRKANQVRKDFDRKANQVLDTLQSTSQSALTTRDGGRVTRGVMVVREVKSAVAIVAGEQLSEIFGAINEAQNYINTWEADQQAAKEGGRLRERSGVDAARQRIDVEKERIRSLEEEAVSHIRQAIRHLQEVYQAGAL